MFPVLFNKTHPQYYYYYYYQHVTNINKRQSIQFVHLLRKSTIFLITLKIATTLRYWIKYNFFPRCFSSRILAIYRCSNRPHSTCAAYATTLQTTQHSVIITSIMYLSSQEETYLKKKFKNDNLQHFFCITVNVTCFTLIYMKWQQQNILPVTDQRHK